MSSPVHHAKDLDAALVYAPPWARGQTRPAPQPLRAAPAEPPRDDEIDPVFSGDRAVLEMQRQLALDPDGVPEPPATAVATLWPMMRRLSIVGCGAALVTAAMMWVIGARPAANMTIAAVLAPPATLGPGDKDQMPDARPQGPAIPVPQAVTSPIVPGAIGPAIASSTESSMAPPVAPPKPAPDKPDNSATLQLGGEEIAMLVKRGRDYLDNGDFASARLLLRRAAQAGSADAALELGATFDPLVIKRLGAIGAAPDAAKARKWYQKAAALGSDSALQHLAALGQQ